MKNSIVLNAISDVHLGCFENENLPDFAFSPDLDILILAGDIMDGVKSHYIDWVLNLNPNLPIIYTPGN
ncbi:hypothetical protein N7931_19460, partial [Catenovulum sp. 2E275]|nr:hypothetical protein [Catenovulum sp. 2E275]